MSSSHHDFANLKRHVSFEQVLQEQGLLERFTRRGERLVGPCPLHRGDNRRAFVISSRRKLWYCFSGCQGSPGKGGGDLVEFVHRLLCLSYRDTAQYLSELAFGDSRALSTCSQVEHEYETRRRAEKEAGGTPHRRAFRPYLRRLPLAHDVEFLRNKGIFPETARRFEAGAYHGPGWLKGCLGVRLFDIEGRPVGYAGRRLNEHEVRTYGKWKFPRGLPAKELLYNYHRVCGQLDQGLFVTECMWSVMRLHQLGVPAIALLGLTLSEPRYGLLSQAGQLTLMMDGDGAGRAATRELARRLAARVNVRTVDLPQGLDPDDLSARDLGRWVHEHARPVRERGAPRAAFSTGIRPK